MKKNYALDPNYVVVHFDAVEKEAPGGALPVVAYSQDTGCRLFRFASFEALTDWAKKLGGNFMQQNDAGGSGYYYRARMIDDDDPPAPIDHATGGLINSLPSDCF